MADFEYPENAFDAAANAPNNVWLISFAKLAEQPIKIEKGQKKWLTLKIS